MANIDDEDELEKEATDSEDDAPEAKGEVPEDVDDDSLVPNKEPKADLSPVDEDSDEDEELADADAIGEDLASKSPQIHVTPENNQLNKFKQYMDQYKQLQDQQRKGDVVNGLIAAGGKIGQSIAGRNSGNFVPDPTGNAMLAKMNERPLQQFELGQAVQGRGMQLQSEMAAADPDSPQSKLVRKYVETRLGLKLDDDVSAADAQMLLKTVGRPIQTKYQKVNGTWTDPTTNESKRMSAIFDPGTGTYKDATSGQPLPGFLAEGLNPFQTVTNPNTGEREVFNKSRGGAPTPMGGKAPVTVSSSPQDINAGLDPVTRKELNDKIVPNFNKLTEKTQQRLMHQAPIMAKLEEAQLNPAAYAQLQAEMARFDVGDQRLAQQEFNMFATRHGYKGWGDWVQKNSTGTISPDFAQDFAHTINNTVRGMQQDLNEQAEKQASLLINRLPPGQKADPKAVAKLIYAGYKPVPSGKSNGKQIVKKGYNAQSDKTQLIYSDGTKEIVDGRQ